MKRIGHHIGGERRDPRGGAWFLDQNPANGAALAEVARGSAEDADDAVDAGRRAIGPLTALSTAARADILDRAAQALLDRRGEAARIESEDTGKPVSLAASLDIARAIANLRFFADAVRQQPTEAYSTEGALSWVERAPLGVVAAIVPWNLPLYLLTWKVAPALATGNVVIAKPSEWTPRSADLLAEVLLDAGLPAGACQVVHGFGSEIGEALIRHEGVDAVSFTGGTTTGARIAAACAAGWKKPSLELGGKNPTVVFADADPDRCADAIWRASFANQGQICLCGERLIVARGIADAVLDRLARRAASLRIGDPQDPRTEWGSLSSLPHRDKVERAVARARELGGEIVFGGARPELPAPWDCGAFYLPTAIDGLPPHCDVARDEIFGPVVTVHRFDDEEEAIALANGSDYGLSASIFTRDIGRAMRLGRRIQAGTIWVNAWLLRDLRVPFGGCKRSGVGREGGRHSLEFFTEARTVCVAREEAP